MRSTDFANFYQRESPALVRFAATVVGPGRADDVVANAVLSVMARVMDNPSVGVPQTEAQLRPYLYRAVANAGAKEWRTISRRARRLALVTARQRPSRQTGPPESDPFHDEIALALAKLSPRQRAVVHLAYWEDLTPTVIAERLEVSEGSVRRHLARARAKLRTVLAAETNQSSDSSSSLLGGNQ